VPLLDLGTVRGVPPAGDRDSHAMDLILTRRGVKREEALRLGLVNRLVPLGQALNAALQPAREIARFPQRCLRSDRLSADERWSLSSARGGALEAARGMVGSPHGLGRAAAPSWQESVLARSHPHQAVLSVFLRPGQISSLKPRP
jgi:hypothetical protein